MFIEQKIGEQERMQPVRSVQEGLTIYIGNVLSGSSGQVQRNLLTDRPWGIVLSSFTRDLGVRLGKVQNADDMAGLIVPLVSRGVELVSGGVVSSHDIPENGRRGLSIGGTWPHSSEREFWSSREYRSEQESIRTIVRQILDIETNASEAHIGRVVTMVLPALISWSDLRKDFVSAADITETVRRILAAEQSGKFQVVTFGCEPYEYEHAPQTTTSHRRRSAFGDENSLREDAVVGSMRGARRILEPLTLSGIYPEYHFYTSSGNNAYVIARQVMPDTVNHYRNQETPEQMLDILSGWRRVIQTAGQQEFRRSGVDFYVRSMESEIVIPALDHLYTILANCGMDLPSARQEFYEHSEEYFQRGIGKVNCIKLLSQHPDPRMLVEFFVNEDEWSQKHPESYASEGHRLTQAGLLSFFEYCQYQRVNTVINSSDIALGIEIDEELILKIRNRVDDSGVQQSPLLWGRPPRFTKDGKASGVAHRQPWFYKAKAI